MRNKDLKIMEMEVKAIPSPNRLTYRVYSKKHRRLLKFKNAALLGSGIASFFGMCMCLEARAYILAALLAIWPVLLLIVNAEK